MTDHSAIVLGNAIAPTAFTNDTVFSSDYISVSLSDVVSGDTNLPFDNQEVPQCETPLHHCQNRVAKYCQRKIFDMLKTVEEKEKKNPKSNHWRSARFLHKSYIEVLSKANKGCKTWFSLQSRRCSADVFYFWGYVR